MATTGCYSPAQTTCGDGMACDAALADATTSDSCAATTCIGSTLVTCGQPQACTLCCDRAGRGCNDLLPSNGLTWNLAATTMPVAFAEGAYSVDVDSHGVAD